MQNRVSEGNPPDFAGCAYGRCPWRIDTADAHRGRGNPGDSHQPATPDGRQPRARAGYRGYYGQRAPPRGKRDSWPDRSAAFFGDLTFRYAFPAGGRAFRDQPHLYRAHLFVGLGACYARWCLHLDHNWPHTHAKDRVNRCVTQVVSCQLSVVSRPAVPVGCSSIDERNANYRRRQSAIRNPQSAIGTSAIRILTVLVSVSMLMLASLVPGPSSFVRLASAQAGQKMVINQIDGRGLA